MKGKILAGLLAVGVALVCASANAQNTVVVPSQTFNGGETGVELRVFLTNDVPLRSIAVPLAIRNTQGAAFITSLQLGWGDRLAAGLSVVSEIQISNTYPAEDGQCKADFPGGFGTFTSTDTLPHAVGGAPVGLLMFRNKIFSSSLTPGADAVGSIRLTVDIGTSQGQFEIDSTCTDPSNHLLFAPDGGLPSFAPDFTKGIFNVGHPPIARDTSWTTDEDVPKNVAYLPASDADGDPLTFSVTSGPANGSISSFNASTGAFTYTPNAAYFGPDSLKFEATDGSFVSNEGTVRITVSHVNAPPVARDTSITTPEDTPVNGQVHATDTDGPNPLTYQHLNGPTHGTLTSFDVNTGAYTYAPAPNYFGSDQFTFRVNDGLANSNVGTVSITVTPVNDPPVARDTVLGVPFGTPTAGKLLASDIDGPALTFAMVAGPFNGSISGFNTTTGVFTYTPDSAYAGPDSILFTASDGEFTSNQAVVRITVSQSNCQCANWSDLYLDGEPNALDLNVMVQVIFFNRLPSLSLGCPTFDADVNCDCFLDALDLNDMINYLLYNQPYSCDPCTADCHLGGLSASSE